MNKALLDIPDAIGHLLICTQLSELRQTCLVKKEKNDESSVFLISSKMIGF